MDIFLSIEVGILIILLAITYYVDHSKPKEVPIHVPDIDKLHILLEDKSIEKINSVIDSYIDEIANTYILMILATDDRQYINTEEQEKMLKYIRYTSLKNLSQDMKDLIGIVYKVESNKDIEEYINLKCKVYMINFIVDFNKEIDQ
jgi:uncharacterized protein YbcI